MAGLAIYLQNNSVGHQNLEHAVATRIWGFRKWEQDFASITPGTLVLLATGYLHPTSGGSPRKPSSTYVQGAMNRILLFRAESPIRREDRPHWPDEVRESVTKYPFRFTMTYLRELNSVNLSQIPFDIAEGFRMSALKQGAGVVVGESAFLSALEAGGVPLGQERITARWGDKTAGIGAFFAAVDPDVIQTLLDGPEAYPEMARWRLPDAGELPIGPGEPYIMTHGDSSGGSVAIGGGILAGTSRILLSELWEWFGSAVGAASREQLISEYESRTGNFLEPSDDPLVDAVVLRDVRLFARAEQVSVPAYGAARQASDGFYFDLGRVGQEHAAMRAVLTYFAPPLSSSADEQVQAVLGLIRGNAREVLPRLGQGAFRAIVSQAYDFRCAITGDRVRPVLEAAHVRAVAAGGEHRLDNGVLLRSDMHTLYDRGFLSLDDDRRLLVSGELRDRFGNGEWLYARVGQEIRVPAREVDRPGRDHLAWHRESVFLR